MVYFVFEIMCMVFHGVFCIWDNKYGIWGSVDLVFGIVYFMVEGIVSLDPRIC